MGPTSSREAASGSDELTAKPSAGQTIVLLPLILPHLRRRLGAPQGAAIRDAIMQVAPVGPGAEEHQDGAGDDGHVHVVPGVAADDGGGNAEHAEPDRRLAAEAALGTRGPSS